MVFPGACYSRLLPSVGYGERCSSGVLMKVPSNVSEWGAGRVLGLEGQIAFLAISPLLVGYGEYIPGYTLRVA